MSFITGGGNSILTTASSANISTNIVYFHDFTQPVDDASKPPPREEDPVLWLRRRVDEVLFTGA